MAPLTHWPTLLQVCGVAPLHWDAPGLQTAPHWLAVTVPTFHWPVVPQVSGVAALGPVHPAWPDVHAPAQLPETQVRFAQVVADDL
jgi:hypothetical protein